MSEQNAEPDMENRDPNDLNSHVKVAFDEVFGEPSGVKSADCVWRCSYKCFNGTFNCCYLVLTYICSIIIAFCWGCEFACLAFNHIWMCTPELRLLEINCVPIKKVFDICMGTFCSPCFEAMGLFFSKIHVTSSTA